MVSALQELNSALSSRYDTMETQLNQVTKKSTVRADIQGLSEDYSTIVSANADLQKEMERVSELTSKF
jgi:predicted transcriptional regulator